MANVHKNVTGSSYLKTEFWTAQNPDDQELLDELVRKARDASIPDAEAIKGLGDFIVAQAEADGVEFECAYFARHFLDDPEANDMIDPETGKKYPHLHFVLHISSKDGKDQGCSFPQWERYIGIDRNRIRKLEGKGGHEQKKDNSISYLTHIKYPEKIQYGPEIVYTARGFDYVELYSQRHSAWIAGRMVITQTRATSKERKAMVLDQINHDLLPYRELISTDEGRLLYSRYMKEINALYAAVAESKRLEKLASYTDNPFVRTNIYFSGDAGHGKSWSAMQLAQRIVEYVRAATGEEWTIFDPADGPNGNDDYSGQEIIIFDDLNPSDMSWEKMKRFFDPFKPISSFGARYKNSQYCARVNIITNTANVYEYFYENRTRAKREHIDQALRRIDFCVDVYNVAADTDTDSLVNTEPTSDTMRLSLRALNRYERQDPMHLKIQFPREPQDILDYKVHFVHRVPSYLPTWLRPETAIELMLEKVMENNGILYHRPSHVTQSINDALVLNEQYDPMRECTITERGRTSDGGEPNWSKQSKEQVQDNRPIVQRVYYSPGCFYLDAPFGKYSIALPSPDDPSDEYRKTHPTFDLYQMRDYLDMLIQQDIADYASMVDEEPEPIDFGGNVFNMRAEDLPFELRQYFPTIMTRKR